MIPLKDDTAAASRPVVTLALIGACCAIFLWQSLVDAALDNRALVALGAIPAVLMGNASLPSDLQWVPRGVPVFTSMFLHSGLMHLLGNMLFLWIYGHNVEDAMGHWRFLAFYLLCGIVAVLAQSVPDPNSAYPIIGASGAISGVLGAYLMLFPRANILTLVLLPFFFTTLRVSAMLLLLLWFAIQLLSDFAVHGDAGVAFRAHIGGFLAGMLLVVFFKRREVALFAR
ncbi:MAG: rhomboid family intramembrane serine protease [Steroidobacterales bacterium]